MRRCAAGWVASADEGLDAFLELAAGEQHAAAARGALQADVRAQPHHVPLVAAAGMWLAQPHYVAKTNLDAHGGILARLTVYGNKITRGYVGQR
jgi:hypothetical protein